MKTIRSFVGMDVHKATISISVAEGRPERISAIRWGDPEYARSRAQNGEAAL